MKNNNKKSFDLIYELTLRLKLVLRLMKERKVPFGLKLIPVLLTLYLPIPDFIPGPLDDLLVFALGLFLFVELCPAKLVEEHLNELRNVIPGVWKEDGKKDEVIDGEVTDIPDPKKAETQADNPESKKK